MLPSLAEVKKHLRLQLSETAEDDLIQMYLDAAIDYASLYTGKDLLVDDVSPSVHSAILLTVSDLYENREAQFVGVSAQENKTVNNLLHFNRVGLGI